MLALGQLVQVVAVVALAVLVETAQVVMQQVVLVVLGNQATLLVQV
jgi:hypothetical protein